MQLLNTETKNQVLSSMMEIMDQDREELLAANKKDCDAFDQDNKALYQRLVVDNAKVDQMIAAIDQVKGQDDPVGRVISERNLDNGLKIVNKTAPFGTILIIYESRPDVTVEAAVLAFKANNKILLKGGKEAHHSNSKLVDFWHRALEANGLSTDYIQLMVKNRTETQEFLRNPSEKLDLIVPRGGERLIAFVKEHAQCAVLVSGRGNNFLYLDQEADWNKSLEVILNAKTHKISACNALDNILVDANLPDYENKLKQLQQFLEGNGVALWADAKTRKVLPELQDIPNADFWKEEFLDYKCRIGTVDSVGDAVAQINEHSGGHSATIMTNNVQTAQTFMDGVDCAAVYQNASTRFTDGGAMGVGAELAISTDKLHHRGPLGLAQLVTNKYYVFGDGQVRTA